MYIKELKNLGLSDKEARVYIAALELGSDTAQNIAKKAGVGRPSTYMQIEMLKKRGLISEVDMHGRRYFVAESPEKLNILIQKIEEDVKIKKTELDGIIDSLMELNRNSENEPPTSRQYEGEDAYRMVKKDILAKTKNSYFGIINIDDFNRYSSETFTEFFKKIDLLVAKSRFLYVSQRDQKSDSSSADANLRKIMLKNDFSSEIIIADDIISITQFNPKIVIIIIENKQIADSFKAIFELLWNS